MTYEEYEELRKHTGLKNADVARLAHIPPSTFTDWKKGKSKPKEDKLNKILRALKDCTLEEWGETKHTALDLFSGPGTMTYKEYIIEQQPKPTNRQEAILNLAPEIIEKLNLLDKNDLDMIIGLIDRISETKKGDN